MSAKYAVIDCETTGLFDYSKRADHSDQPRMASFSVATLDEDLMVEHCHHMYIYPEGWKMSKETEEINGLSTAFLQNCGVSVIDALSLYTAKVKAGLTICSFNASFDSKVLRGELRRAGMDDLYNETETFCVMKAMTPICKLPGKRGGYKWPKLSEAMEFCGIPQVGSHDSMMDVIDTVRVLHWMKKNMVLPADMCSPGKRNAV